MSAWPFDNMFLHKSVLFVLRQKKLAEWLYKKNQITAVHESKNQILPVKAYNAEPYYKRAIDVWMSPFHVGKL